MFEQSVELAMIDIDKSLSVQRKCFNTIIWLVPFMFHYTDYQCFNTIIWLVPFMFHYTDYQPPLLLHLYGCHLCFFSFFRSMDGKKQIPHVLKCVKMTHHSCWYPNWLQRYGINYMSWTSRRPSLIWSLWRLRKKFHPHCFNHYRILMQNRVKIHF